jgi:hypothetical protein
VGSVFCTLCFDGASVGVFPLFPSLKHASRLWKAMFEGRDTGELRKTTQMFEEMGFTE